MIRIKLGLLFYNLRIYSFWTQNKKKISDTNHSHTNSLMYYFFILYVSLNIFQIVAFTARKYLQ
jgi:hypothetical protein